ncbi:hypothetical protein F511_34303 [Dorcoceras hygrometricum]|uniref:Uncharacterized protein n=1 Tax=Dorcoceras hygrometricum TaxID=472368 RepID=A0A2Z7BEB8_9LAMI|nr:hypothetical protein F511_34303 [Dorcoceras hygrometricum]
MNGKEPPISRKFGEHYHRQIFISVNGSDHLKNPNRLLEPRARNHTGRPIEINKGLKMTSHVLWSSLENTNPISNPKLHQDHPRVIYQRSKYEITRILILLRSTNFSSGYCEGSLARVPRTGQPTTRPEDFDQTNAIVFQHLENISPRKHILYCSETLIFRLPVVDNSDWSKIGSVEFLLPRLFHYYHFRRLWLARRRTGRSYSVLSVCVPVDWFFRLGNAFE